MKTKLRRDDPKNLDLGTFLAEDQKAFFQVEARNQAANIVRKLQHTPAFGQMVLDEAIKQLQGNKPQRPQSSQDDQGEYFKTGVSSALFGGNE